MEGKVPLWLVAVHTAARQLEIIWNLNQKNSYNNYETVNRLRIISYSTILWVWYTIAFRWPSSDIGQRRSMNKNVLSSVSLACLGINFVVKGAGTVILLFRLKFKTSVICHNENTEKLLTPVWNLWKPSTYLYCSSEENSFRDFTLKNWTMIFISIRSPWLCQYKYI